MVFSATIYGRLRTTSVAYLTHQPQARGPGVILRLPPSTAVLPSVTEVIFAFQSLLLADREFIAPERPQTTS